MPKETEEKSAAQVAPEKTVRVRVLKHGLKYRKMTCAEGHIIESMPISEYELRKADKEIELLNVNP